ncbi:PleD family two-component system response regulator [Aurantimonas sp. VKM B-3413]|uniref:PleD family two-component system response regulator n=1 Tax=Aurantimonas sp. VKM B-3413 TaxID=2779401 RepID=UPI001E4CB1AD|nr:PleD family two-component system response regulator [Aurantimonas sp. VKM B-3413]MCB8838481.1 PleD family two-component system response regulator [Aurantimonas sp. VKM B-3413]
MTARILIVDDIEINLRVLEARLSAEYYEVIAARSGPEALAICRSEPIDLVLLDVMMPDMDGFAVCRAIKSDPALMHLPVVLITALDQPADRVAGLEAGADDFLTKPVRDLPLFARVRSLARLKLVTDELRRRAETAMQIVTSDRSDWNSVPEDGAKVLAFVPEPDEARRLGRQMRGGTDLAIAAEASDFLARCVAGEADVAIVDLTAEGLDPLRLVSQLRSLEATRRLPVLALTALGDEVGAAKALELGANDYVQRPIDRGELSARIRIQFRRRRYDERLRSSVQQTMELAVSDPLTGLHNRRFFEIHLARAVERAGLDGSGVALLIADIDHFKRINDGFGHEAGDHVLKQFAERLLVTIRASDLACRFGGEEFAVLLHEADLATAMPLAERIRNAVAGSPFDISGEPIAVTVSQGVAVFQPGVSDSPAALFRRADAALYAAKRGGRNRVESAAAA